MKSELQEACEQNHLHLKSVHVRVDYSDPKHPTDRWTCTLSHTTRGTSADFEFQTGIGCRKLCPGIEIDGPGRWYTPAGYMCVGYAAAIDAKILKLVPPECADLVVCLLSDLEACECSFEEWCGTFGENPDSRKALDCYLACQRNGDNVRKVLGYDLVKELRSKEH